MKIAHRHSSHRAHGAAGEKGLGKNRVGKMPHPISLYQPATRQCTCWRVVAACLVSVVTILVHIPLSSLHRYVCNKQQIMIETRVFSPSTCVHRRTGKVTGVSRLEQQSKLIIIPFRSVAGYNIYSHGVANCFQQADRRDRHLRGVSYLCGVCRVMRFR